MKGAHRSVPIALALLVSACSTLPAGPASGPAPSATPVQMVPAGRDPFAPPAGDLTRVDQQGAIRIEVTPLNLTPAENLHFDVSMNTHSVDLSMDLATLATLSSDAGVAVKASSWDGPRGGHHVAGKLVFPAAKDGKSIFDGASRLTLTIVDVDSASRVFEWEVK
jgi:hypothetical protein